MQSVLKVSALKLGKAAHVKLPCRERSGTVTKPPRVQESGGLSSGSCFRTLEAAAGTSHIWQSRGHFFRMLLHSTARIRPFLPSH